VECVFRGRVFNDVSFPNEYEKILEAVSVEASLDEVEFPMPSTQRRTSLMKIRTSFQRMILVSVALFIAVAYPIEVAANGTARYFDVNGVTAGFGTPSTSGSYSTSGSGTLAYWTTSNQGNVTAGSFTTGSQMTFGYGSGTLAFNNAFSINSSSATMDGILIADGSTPTVSLVGIGNLLPASGSSWTVAVGATLKENVNYSSFGGMNFNSAALTLTGGGTINFVTAIGANSAGLITQTGSVTVNLQQTVLPASTREFKGGYTLSDGYLNFNTGTAADAFGSFPSGKYLTINGGTIDNTSGSAATMSLGTGSYSIGGDFAFKGSSALSFGTAAVALTATPTITVTASTLTIGGTISGGYGINKAGAGTLLLTGNNSFTGETVVSAGVLSLGHNNALGTTAGGVTVTGTAQLRLSGTRTISGEWATISGAGGGSGAIYVTGGGGTWTGNVTIGASGTRIGTNGSDGSTLTISGAIDSGGSNYGLTVRIGSSDNGTVTLSGANTYVGITTVSIGTLKIDKGDDRLPTGTTLLIGWTGGGTPYDAIFDLNGWNQEVSGLSTNTLSSTGTTTSDNQIIKNSSSTLKALTVNTTGSYSFGGVIQGTLSFVKTGTGTQVLSGVNTYTGGTTLTGGILNVGTDTALGVAGSTITFNGGTLQYDGSVTTLTLGNSTITINTGIGAVVDVTSNTLILSGIIRGNGSLTKVGGSALKLTGNNTYTGGTTINNGRLYVTTSASALGTGSVTVADGAQAWFGVTGIANPFYIAGIGISDDVTYGNMGAFRIDNGVTASGTITLNADARIGGTSGTGTLTGVITGNHNLEVNSGGGSCQLSVVLTGKNTYTGDTIVNSGTLVVNCGVNNSVASGNIYVNLGAQLTLSNSGTTVVQLGAGNSANWFVTGGTLSIANGKYEYVKAITMNSGANWSLGTGTLVNGLIGANFALASVTSSGTSTGCSTISSAGGALSASSGITFNIARGAFAGTSDLTDSASLTDYNGAAGRITKTGDGILTLTGVNPYTGATTINAGTLALSGSGSIGSSATITVGGGAVFDVSGVTSYKLGSGQTLKGIGTIKGDATLNGRLSPGASAGSITFADNATLASGGHYLWEVGTVSGSGLQGSAGINFDQQVVNGTLTLNNSGSYNIDITGLGAVAGWNPRNSYQWVIATATVGISGTGTFNLNASGFTDVLAGGTFSMSHDSNNLVLTFTGGSASIDSYWGVGGAGDGTWDTGTTPAWMFYSTGSGGSYTWTADDAAIFSTTGAGAGPFEVAVGAGGVSAKSITINGGTPTLSGGTITLTGAGGTISVTGAGTIASVVGGTVGLTKTGTGVLALSGNNTYTGNTRVDSGTLALSGVSTGSGFWNAYGGILSINSLDAINNSNTGTGSTSYLAVQNGGTFQYTGTGSETSSKYLYWNSGSATIDITSATGSLNWNPLGGTRSTYFTKTGLGTLTLGSTGTISGGSVTVNSGVLVLNGASTYTGGTTLTGGILNAGTATALGAAGSTITFNGGTLQYDGSVANLTLGNSTITINTGVGAVVDVTRNTLIMSGIIRGNGSLTKVGGSSLKLTGNNTYTGGTTINNGRLYVTTSASAFGTGSVTVADGAQAWFGITGMDNRFNISGIGIDDGGTYGNMGAFRIDNAVTASGTITLNADARIGGISGTATLSGVVTGNHGLEVNSGGGSCQLSVVLSGVNTYTGGTTIRGGTLTVGNARALGTFNTGSDGTLTMSGGVLNLGNFGLLVGALTGSSTITGGTSTSLLKVTQSGSSTFSGVIQDGGGTVSLTKAGTGVLTLTGAGTYTGITTVDGGELDLNAPTNKGVPADLTINSTGTVKLLAAHQVANASQVTINTGGTLDFNGNYDVVDSFVGNGSIMHLNASGTSAGDSAVAITTGSATFSGIISGTGSGNSNYGNVVLRSNGAGMQVFTGSMSLANGVILVANNGTAGFRFAGSAIASVKGINLGSFSYCTFGNNGAVEIMDNAVVTVGTSGILQGAGTLTKMKLGGGTGTATLQAGASWSSSSPFTLSNGTGAPVIDTQTFSTTLSGTLSGAGGLTKVGDGTLTLSGVNGYTGGTTLTAGSLLIGNANALGTSGTITFAGGTLASSSSTAYILGNSGSLNFIGDAAFGQTAGNTGTGALTLTGKGIISATAHTLTVNNNTTLSGVIGGTGSLTKGGTGILVLTGNNTFTGAVEVNAGILRLDHNSALGTTAGGVTVTGTAQLRLSGTRTISGEWATISGGGGGAGALNVTSGGGTWTGNVTIGASLTRIGTSSGSSLTISGAINSEGADRGLIVRCSDDTGTVTLSGANTYVGSTIVYLGTLKIDGGSDRLPKETTLQIGWTLNNSIDAAFDLNGWSQEISGLSINAFSGTLTTADNRIVRNSSSVLGTLTVNTPFGSSTSFEGVMQGTLSFVKTGAGTQVLSGVSTYTGGTTISGGILNVGTETSLGASTGTVTFDGGTLQFGGTGIALGASRRGTITANGAYIDTGSFSGSIAGTISGAGGLTKVGANTLTLSGNNAYAGATAVNTGVLTLGNNNALGTMAGGVTVSSGAQLQLNSGITITGEWATLSGSGTSGNTKGALNSNATGTGSSTWAGNVTIAAAGTRVGAETGNLTISGIIDSGGSNYGLLARSYIGGTVTLSGINAYVGETHVACGALKVSGGDNRLPTGTTLKLGWTGAGSELCLFDLNGQNQEIAGLTDAIVAGTDYADHVVRNSGALKALTVNASSAASSFAGTIAGSLTLAKNGTYPLSLSGPNTYTGGTTVDGGKLLAKNTSGSATGTGSVTVNSGGTLGGTGTLSGAVTITNGGTLAPGDTSLPGTLTVGGALTFDSGSRCTMRILSSASHDMIVANGLVSNGATLTLETSLFDVAGTSGILWLINNTGVGDSGTFSGYDEGATVSLPNGEWQITYKASYPGSTSGNDAALIPPAGTTFMFQ